MRLQIISTYNQARYDFLKRVEGEPTDGQTGEIYAYTDSKSIPTMGIGINVQTHFNLALGLLGFDSTGSTLTTPEARLAEQGYIAEIRNVILNGAFQANDTGSGNQVRADLRNILRRRGAGADRVYGDVRVATGQAISDG